MATKMSNHHLGTIFNKCREYYILDTYISLVHRAVELKDDKFIIQTFDNSKPHLVSLVGSTVNATYKTILGCITKLMDLDILRYDEELNGWIFTDMEYMVKPKEEVPPEKRHLCQGYTKIHRFFFTAEFQTMRSMEKRLLVYMAQLKDSKANAAYNGTFTANLNKSSGGNSSWYKILKTRDKYYARKIISTMIKKYGDVLTDLKDKASEVISYIPKKINSFIMKFKCTYFEKEDANKEENQINGVFEANGAEYSLIMDKLRFFNITLTRKKIMHMILSVSNLKEWFLKERVVQIIINKYIAIQKYKSRDDIKSLPAYAAAVVKTVVSEYKDFKRQKAGRTFLKYEIGAQFEDYMESLETEILSKEIQEELLIFET